MPRTIASILRAAAGMLLIACVACSAREENVLLGNTRVLKLEGSAVTASGIYLAGDDGENLLTLLSGPGVDRLNIGYVPGGHAIFGFKLFNVLAGKSVVITGPCASACANGVINAASVSFARAQVGEMPPMLAFHGLFRQTGERIENATVASKRYAKTMKKRFPYLAIEDLEEALAYPMAGISGLVVAPSASGGLDFSLCQPWPAKCRAIHHLEHDSL